MGENRVNRDGKGPGVWMGHKGPRLAWMIGSLLLILLFLTLSMCYLHYVKETIRRDAKGNLMELGNNLSQSLHSEISSTNHILGSLALEASRGHITTEEGLVQFLSEQAAFWHFYDLALIDKEGISHHQDGSQTMPINGKLLSKAVDSEKMTFDFLLTGGKKYVLFYVPVPRNLQAQTGYLAINGTLAVQNWDWLRNVRLFEGRAMTQIITREGVVITCGLEGQDQVNYNLLDSPQGVDFEPGITLEQVRQAMREEESLCLSYRLDGEEYYFCCCPVGFNGWNLAFSVPAGMVNSAGDQMFRSVLVICAGLSVLFLLFLLYFRASQFQAQQKIWSAAYVDEVTGGANRHKFLLDAKRLLARGGVEYVLVYSNIDQFKMLNQRYETAGADYILRNIHRACQQILSERESCARLTADHFVLLLQREGAEDRLAALAREQAVQQTLDGRTCQIRLTFGLCPVEPGEQELTGVIDRANLAMKMSPATGSGIVVYTAAMMERAAREKALTERLLQESVWREFTIHLQPKVDLATGKVIGAEALARWISPEFGAVSPGEFIPLAEKAGIVCQVDWFAFASVCRILAKWEREGRELIPISFNLSKAQLSSPNFLDHYREVIQEHQIACQYLDFEFTESLLYENSGALQAAVDEIHGMGAWCSVDDFGFGYSSLGLLGQFEADTLKLDRSFFRENAQPDSRSNRIIHSVIQIASNLGMQTVAEGVEGQEHVEMLRQFGCGAVQGFYYSRPLPLEEFEQFAAERREGIVT